MGLPTWIDFDDRLPEVGAIVQVKCECVHGERDERGELKRVERQWVTTGERIEGGFMIDGVGWFDSDDDACGVLAWAESQWNTALDAAIAAIEAHDDSGGAAAEIRKLKTPPR